MHADAFNNSHTALAVRCGRVLLAQDEGGVVGCDALVRAGADLLYERVALGRQAQAVPVWVVGIIAAIYVSAQNLFYETRRRMHAELE